MGQNDSPPQGGSTGPRSSIGQVFLTVLTHGPLCRRDVAELTGLSQGAVTRLAKPMIDAGYLIETEPVSEGPGRPMVPLQVIPTRRFAIGIKVREAEASVARDLGPPGRQFSVRAVVRGVSMR